MAILLKDKKVKLKKKKKKGKKRRYVLGRQRKGYLDIRTSALGSCGRTKKEADTGLNKRSPNSYS
jgi:hypothetical protein